MIKISVISYNNEAPAQILSAIFDKKGGTLGRSDDNYFVLPDPKRYVSRLQASIRSDGMCHKIVNLSQANPILINGQEIDSRQEYDLNVGDEIQIGLYLLRAELHSDVDEESEARTFISNDDVTQFVSATNDLDSKLTGQALTDPFDPGLSDVAVSGLDPFADLLGPLASPAVGVSPNPVEMMIETIPRPFPSSAATHASIKPADDDPLASASRISVLPPPGNHIPETSNQNVPSGFDDLLSSPTHNTVLSELGAPAIPDDFDPFAFPSQSLRNPSDPLANLPDNDITLESLKNSKAGLTNLMTPASDLHGGSLLDASNLKMNDSSEVDPLVLFSSNSVWVKKPGNDGSGGHAVSNHVPEMNAHFRMPQVNQTVLQENKTVPSNTVGGRVLSAPALFDATSDPAQLHKEPDMNCTYLPNSTVELTPEKSTASEPAVSPAILGEDPEPATNAGSVDRHELMQAFLRGAGIPPNTIFSRATPEFMEIIGELLAASLQGTVELIASRALVKREVRADMTMIVAQKNNPLKFLPDGQTVLMQMLREKIPGFMEPVEAIQDAYEDLRAHQIGVVAGMRAAMAEVLERFNPELLEQRMKDHSFIDSVLPANRKAKMWDQYTELFQQIRLKAQDDFQVLFGKAFVAAYEVEIERFKKGRQDD